MILGSSRSYPILGWIVLGTPLN
ncbi:hypothetical protein LINPERPRIM_LOCUS40501 [Linum perenne]